MAKIAVDEGLTNVKDLLQREGFEVVVPEKAADVVAVVTSGMRDNMLGMQNMTVDTPVIDASGKTPTEVLAAVKDSLRKREPGER